MDYRAKWAVETAVSHLFGVGSRVDTYSNEFNIADFKSKEFDPDEELGIWPNQGLALAAYRGMLGFAVSASRRRAAS